MDHVYIIDIKACNLVESLWF